MKIGIIVAMDKELRLLEPLLENMMNVMVDDYRFTCGRLSGHDIIALKTGIGKVNAAVGVLTLINNFDVDMIINTGVAGGASKQVNVMDIVVAERVAYHDVWCGPETTPGAVQGLPLYYEAPTDMLKKIPSRHDIKVGLICSGDQFVDSIAQVEAIQKKFPEVLAVDMESGAIAQVCYLREIPFFSMRVISDSPGGGHDNAAEYNDFWTEAPQHTFDVLKHILKSL